MKPGDIAIFATPPAFRWVHFTYAIEKGLNVFMEKPVTVDGPTSTRMLSLAQDASAKNLKVGVGLMSRHSRALQELAKRVHDGEIGQIILQRGYRMHGPGGYFSSLPKPAGISDLLYQVQRFHSFIWASGGCFNDFYIHIIDHLGWMKNAWPVKAQALGGRHYRRAPKASRTWTRISIPIRWNTRLPMARSSSSTGGPWRDANRSMPATCTAPKEWGSLPSTAIAGTPSSLYKGQTPTPSNMIWKSRVNPEEQDPYQNEWNDLMDAIRNDKPYNEAKRGTEASLVTSMGRMAAHTGQDITYDEILNCEHEFAPHLDKLTMDSPAPLPALPNGKYPVPQPGLTGHREF